MQSGVKTLEELAGQAFGRAWASRYRPVGDVENAHRDDEVGAEATRDVNRQRVDQSAVDQQPTLPVLRREQAGNGDARPDGFHDAAVAQLTTLSGHRIVFHTAVALIDAATFAFSVLLMLLFLMMQLHSFSLMGLVLAVLPMCMIGVVGGLLLAGKPLGFVAILGILALLGMIACNAVLLIEQIGIDRKAGMKPWDAVLSATMSRFRPIFLTAVSTVLGMIPIAGTVFWGPMAVTIMGGLTVATLLTLIGRSVVTDSASGITPEAGRQHGITVVPTRSWPPRGSGNWSMTW